MTGSGGSTGFLTFRLFLVVPLATGGGLGGGTPLVWGGRVETGAGGVGPVGGGFAIDLVAFEAFAADVLIVNPEECDPTSVASKTKLQELFERI